MHILMAAAENDALPGGKVGGVGDVIRDIPIALAEEGHSVDVVTPGYGALSLLAGSRRLASFEVRFAAELHPIEVYEVPSPKRAHERVRNIVLESPLFAVGGKGVIYCNDDSEPFATDSSKFALFSLAIAEAVVRGVLPKPEVLHLHDWHSAVVAILREYDPRFASLRSIRTVFSIHNLSLQGIRPFEWNYCSLDAWFYPMGYDRKEIGDPRYNDCYNPMRAGIRLCDRVHAVSPTYAEEILRPSDPAHGFIGGEGLEEDLQEAALEGRLVGVLNGADYEVELPKRPTRAALFDACEAVIDSLMAKTKALGSAHYLADKRLGQWRTSVAQEGHILITSIGRITDQKMSLLAQPHATEKSVLDALLTQVKDRASLLLIGSGDAKLEAFLTRVAGDHKNFLFINGYAEALSDQVYVAGDLFLMPSSFEPCGISQMLAMRAAQPCLVHAVGGLKDTVEDGVTGFSFDGDTPAEQAANMLSKLEAVVRTKRRGPKKWQTLRKRAAAQRFLWRDAAKRYTEELYS